MDRSPFALLVALAVLVLGVALAFSGRRMRLENIRGNTVVGNVKGNISQTYTGDSSQSPPAAASGIGRKEVIGWVIAVPAAALAAWNLWRGLIP